MLLKGAEFSQALAVSMLTFSLHSGFQTLEKLQEFHMVPVRFSNDLNLGYQLEKSIQRIYQILTFFMDHFT